MTNTAPDQPLPAKRRKQSARFTDIATLAGVSPATVDRVLNERGSVSAKSRVKVIEAARQLALPRHLPQLEHGLIHLEIILPDNRTPFFQRLKLALRQAGQMLDKRIVIHSTLVDEQDEAGVVRRLLQPRYPRKGLIVAAPDTPAVQAALQSAARRGEAIALIVTWVEHQEQARYVGIDNYKAGRTAGYLLGKLCRTPGHVLLLTSRYDYKVHQERIRGCQQAVTEQSGWLQCQQQPEETHDDADKCYRAIARAFKQGEAISGIYNSGAGSAGIAAALQKYDPDNKVVWISHEMSDDHRDYLQQGLLDVVIDQDPDNQAWQAIQHLLASAGVIESPVRQPGTSEFRLYFAENLRQTRYLE